jgi:hypothetical protein
LINQVPTQEKPNAYIRKIKTVQFIYIFKKAGLMNQAPTEESNPYRNNQAPTQEPNSYNQFGFHESIPTESTGRLDKSNSLL